MMKSPQLRANSPARTSAWVTVGTVLLVSASSLSVASSAASGPEPGWRRKVDPWVLEKTSRESPTEFLVFLRRQADLRGAAVLASKAEKGRYVFEQLRATAARSQTALLEELQARGIAHRPYWIANMIWVRGDRTTVQAMAQRRDVARIHANPWVPLKLPEGVARGVAGCPQGVEPSLVHVGASAFWDQGITGQGVVVGGQDTGYDWDHPALQSQYRGWNGAGADHNYHWHDAVHSGGGACGADSPEPCDDYGHGTHTMGTIVGDDGVYRVGMAPGARWIGCRNMSQGVGTPTTYSECFQFFLAPTDLNGENPDPDRAPDVVNNSWGCPTAEGCTDPNVMKTVVENLRAAGIAMVVSAGNKGSMCSTVVTPAAIYDAVLTVGATDNNDLIAPFSSRGPVTVDSSGRLKPDVSAPGVGICSSMPGGVYGSKSGTSMASPHVAGLMALLLAARPCWRGDVDAIEAYVIGTALPRTILTQDCGGILGTEVPNNTFGYGAVRAVVPAPSPCPIFSDGFESGDSTVWSATTP
ncbi:MAG: S8 family serine peptidase [bacterium]|nr:S8 family serine peptidase [bacterium]